MTLDQLKYFREVANCLNFSKAGASLYVSQSSLSRGVAALEAELGVALFVRNTHSVLLTAAGEKMYDHVEKLMQGLDEAVIDVRNTGNGMSAVVRPA